MSRSKTRTNSTLRQAAMVRYFSMSFISVDDILMIIIINNDNANILFTKIARLSNTSARSPFFNRLKKTRVLGTTLETGTVLEERKKSSSCYPRNEVELEWRRSLGGDQLSQLVKMGFCPRYRKGERTGVLAAK